MANASQSAPKTIFTVSSHAQDQDPEETQPSVSAVPDASAGRESVMDKVGNWAPFLLIRSAHPRQAVLTAIGLHNQFAARTNEIDNVGAHRRLATKFHARESAIAQKQP